MLPIVCAWGTFGSLLAHIFCFSHSACAAFKLRITFILLCIHVSYSKHSPISLNKSFFTTKFDCREGISQVKLRLCLLHTRRRELWPVNNYVVMPPNQIYLLPMIQVSFRFPFGKLSARLSVRNGFCMTITP